MILADADLAKELTSVGSLIAAIATLIGTLGAGVAFLFKYNAEQKKAREAERKLYLAALEKMTDKHDATIQRITKQHSADMAEVRSELREMAATGFRVHARLVEAFTAFKTAVDNYMGGKTSHVEHRSIANMTLNDPVESK